MPKSVIFSMLWTVMGTGELKLPDNIDIKDENAVKEYIHNNIEFCENVKQEVNIAGTRKITPDTAFRFKTNGIRNIGNGIVSDCIYYEYEDFAKIINTVFGEQNVIGVDMNGVCIKPVDSKQKIPKDIVLSKLSGYFDKHVTAVEYTHIPQKKAQYQVSFIE